MVMMMVMMMMVMRGTDAPSSSHIQTRDHVFTVQVRAQAKNSAQHLAEGTPSDNNSVGQRRLQNIVTLSYQPWRCVAVNRQGRVGPVCDM
eukprot:1116859-Rhodomonas_salina.1